MWLDSQCRLWRNWLMGLPRRRGWVVDFLLGGLLPLALPPFGLWPLFLFIMPSIFWRCAAGAHWRAVALTGWLFGFGQFLSGLYWVGASFLVEADRFLWALPFAVFLLTAGLGLFYALSFAVWRWWVGSAPSNIAAMLSWVVCLSATEWLRGHILTGLPWNLPGMAFLGWLPLAQAASLWGIYGQSLLVLLLALLPAMYLYSRAGAFIFLCCFGILAGGGWARLALSPPTSPSVAEIVRVRIVQPAILQKEKWQPQNRAAIIHTYLALTQFPWQGKDASAENNATSNAVSIDAPPDKDLQADIIIWPETALPALIDREPELRARIADALPQGSILITGALRREPTQPADYGAFKSFNSILVLNDAGEIITIYDKHHLVPFGEYLPFAPLLARLGLASFTAGQFTAGSPPQIQYVEGIPPFIPLICYEVIFPALITGASRMTASDRIDANKKDTDSAKGQRAGWLVNVTNDGWFGRTIGPRQHLAAAQMRAIEMGVPLVRAANTGISALIDGRGRLVDFRPLYVRNVLDVTLPSSYKPTFYSRFGDLVFFFMLFICVGMTYGLRRLVV